MKLNIIPTPQFVSATAGSTEKSPVDRIKSIYVDEALKKSAEAALKFLPAFAFTGADDAQLVITTDKKTAEELCVLDCKWFENRNAAEQGYIIRGLENGRILIYAQNPLGIMYAVATLLQIPAIQPEFEIKDYPEFRYRGNRWLTWAETEIWSYDFGDGPEAFTKRIIRKLDMCLKYKVNMIFFDGLGFGSDRFTGYGKLVKNLCREARKRGIHLISGGYTMGYGIVNHIFGYLFGEVHKNRHPNGEVYNCMGSYLSSGEDGIVAGEFGGCLSNDALTQEKVDEIVKYIRDTEMGGFYMHNIDDDIIHQELWLARCDSCRAKWPNDDVFAKDGMAGALAYFFDALNGGLQNVKTDEYDSSRDLLLFNISPGYMWYYRTDEECRVATKFWACVQEYSKVKNNVIPTFRELFFNHDDNTERIAALAESLSKDQDFGIINFSGADGFHTDKLFFTAALYNYFYKGANSVISCAGNAFSEPLQIFNAEYMWNVDNSAFYNITDRPDNYKDFLELYFDIQNTRFRPEEIYGEGGMLDIICEKLYGENAGAMSKLFKLCGENYECVVPFACNRETLTAGNNVRLSFRWDNELDVKEQERLVSSFAEMKRLTAEAADILAAEKNPSEDVSAYLEMLRLNLPLLSYWHEYLTLYRDTDAAFRENKKQDLTAIDRINILQQKAIDTLADHRARHFILLDVMEGALARRTEMLEAILYNLGLIKKSIETEKRIPDDRANFRKVEWW